MLSTSLSSFSPVPEKRVAKLKTKNNILSQNSSSEISTLYQSEEDFLVNEENQENFSIPKLKPQSKNLIFPDQIRNKTQYTEVLYDPDVGLFVYDPLTCITPSSPIESTSTAHIQPSRFNFQRPPSVSSVSLRKSTLSSTSTQSSFKSLTSSPGTPPIVSVGEDSVFSPTIISNSPK
ncbi:hypothetical protein KQX54_010732 [Cotesia glomerata]|uniref:Uncharacterized protein n=1 Tax=Cotesia glomerata TaxID=32391 RepID=A0AAV7I6Q8_COTGL|nr:hypothetical protein KQX54_010732 [Cotesia glomerata]